MFSRPCLVVFLSLGIHGTTLSSVSAQQPGNDRDIVYEAARNKIGLLHYCRDASLLEPAVANRAIEIAERGLVTFASAAAPAVRGYGDQAEDEGEVGFLGPNGRRSIDTFAEQFNTTPANLCQEWAAESLRGVKGRSVKRLDPAQAPSATYLPGTPPKPGPLPVPLPVAAPATLAAPAALAVPAPAAQSLPPARQEPRRSFPATLDSSPECP